MNDLTYYEQLLRNSNDYYRMVLNYAVAMYEHSDWKALEVVRSELHAANLLIFFQGLVGCEQFNNMEIFVNKMLGGK